ncbi:MAG: VOC family protein [Bacteroidetes bacterium]|nr:VOC family protein [Bacteroidota bacterium]
MAKVFGIGGIFFKSKDPDKLIEWYTKWLGMDFGEYKSTEFKKEQLPEKWFGVISPFKLTTDYFNPSKKDFMINLVVDDVDEALEQVKEGGGQITGEIERHEYGTFGWFIDPEGNKVELWKP